MNKYCILSTDNNPSYYELLPLVCHSWRKTGYEPVVLTVGLDDNVKDLIEQYCNVKTLPCGPEPGVKDSTLAQLWRLFMGRQFAKDDILITADADMIIACDIFTHDVSQGQIVSYGFDLTGRSELPICYIKATAGKWRELMGEFTIPDKSYSDKWEDYWSVDQQLLTQRAREYGIDRITFVDRGNQNKHGLPTGRWDRYDWANIPDSIIDVHMKRGDWDAQIQVAERLWPGKDHSFITKFREALEGYEVTDINKEVKIKMDGVEIRALATDTQALDKLMIATKDIADAYNYPAQLLGSHAIELKAPININDIIEPEPLCIDIPDEFGFLKNIDNWSNHRPLLLLALHLAPGDVYEFGCGDGSTSYLRNFCESTGRRFRSFESNEVWALKCGSEFVKNWDDDMLYWPCSVAFVDHAPGEHRHIAVKRLAEFADIIVIHDTEEGGAGDYKFDRIWHLFKYRLNYNKTGGGAGATAVSNIIDLNKFRGLSLGSFTFDKD